MLTFELGFGFGSLDVRYMYIFICLRNSWFHRVCRMSFPVAILCEDAQVDIIELETGNWLAKAINGRLINKALSRGVSFEVSDYYLQNYMLDIACKERAWTWGCCETDFVLHR